MALVQNKHLLEDPQFGICTILHKNLSETEKKWRQSWYFRDLTKLDKTHDLPVFLHGILDSKSNHGEISKIVPKGEWTWLVSRVYIEKKLHSESSFKIFLSGIYVIIYLELY